MKYIRTMTQQKLSFWLALYIGWFMNVAVFFRRFDGYAQEFTFWKGLSGVVELVATVFVTFFLLRLLSLFGRRIWRILATLIVLFSAAFAHLQQQAAMKVPRRHVELYDTIMGCLGYTSPDGGINENNNWCRWKK